MINLYRLRAWFEYRRNAIGRHGLHSPAIYQLMDQSLRGAKPKFTLPLFRDETGITWKGTPLLMRIAAHFQIKKVVVRKEAGLSIFFLNENSDPQTNASLFDTIWIFDSAVNLLDQFDSLKNQFAPKLLIAVPEMHADANAEKAWDLLLQRPEVRASLDFFETGILIFAPGFRQKQRFVLKYPV